MAAFLSCKNCFFVVSVLFFSELLFCEGILLFLNNIVSSRASSERIQWKLISNFTASLMAIYFFVVDGGMFTESMSTLPIVSALANMSK